MDKVIRLIDKQPEPRSSSWSLVQAMEDAIESINKGDLPNKGLVLILNDVDGGFECAWLKAGVLTSEAITILELAKADLVDLIR